MRYKAYYIPNSSGKIWSMDIYTADAEIYVLKSFEEGKEIILKTADDAEQEDLERLKQMTNRNMSAQEALHEVYLVREDNKLFNMDIFIDNFFGGIFMSAMFDNNFSGNDVDNVQSHLYKLAKRIIVQPAQQINVR